MPFRSASRRIPARLAGHALNYDFFESAGLRPPAGKPDCGPSYSETLDYFAAAAAAGIGTLSTNSTVTVVSDWTGKYPSFRVVARIVRS